MPIATRACFALLMTLATTALAANVRFGIDVLEDDNFQQLAGKRVGVIANPASVNASLRHTADVLAQSGKVNLVALFGPEHGIYGNEYAGDKVEDRIDPRTGIPIYSLYGKINRPTTRMVEKMDALIVDLQDIGARSYTYIATMKRCMESCAEHDRELIILDRPNPLGGVRVEGPGLVEGYESGVSSLPVPYVHGMTMGELAQLTRDKFFPNFKKLTVIKMRGWNREMVWSDTGHEWIPTSPHVPTERAVAGYVATGILGELYIINIGVGYTLPFEMVGAPWLDGETLAAAMPKQKGVFYRPVYFKPFYSTFKGEPCQGIQIHMDPKTAENLVQINYQLLHLLGAERLFEAGDAKAKREAETAAAEKKKAEAKAAATRPATRPTTRRSRRPATTQALKWDPRTKMFDKVSGSDEPRKWLMEQKDLNELFAKWKRECDQFRAERKKYLLY